MANVNSYYLYQKYEKRGDQPWIQVYPSTYSADGDGTMPLVVKQLNDPACGASRFVLTLNDSSVIVGECSTTSAVTSGETSQYSGTATSVLFGTCCKTISGRVFNNASNLSSVTFSDSVTSIGSRAFRKCYALTNITFPNSLTSIGEGAFQTCTGITSLSIPSGATSIDANSFEACSGLTSITVDSNNAVYDSRDNCNAIINSSTNSLICGCKNTVIPSTVTSIGNYAFSYCKGLTSITVPSGVASIGDYGFNYCTNLTSLTIEAVSPPTLGNYSLKKTNDCVIYVPAESVSAYQSAWSDFANRIQAIS